MHTALVAILGQTARTIVDVACGGGVLGGTARVAVVAVERTE